MNIFVTTGISILLLSIVALFYKADYLYLNTVFQVLGANIIVHLGLVLIHRIQIKYVVLETVLDVILIIGALLAFGIIFDWFTSTPIWVLVIMGIIMYMASLLLNLLQMKKEAKELNALIKKRNEKTKFVQVP
ncbi:MAG: hypothetical protein NC089_09975 [Bacteroides sp.]|nr:hypothetical protein [Bacteroides sp.]MCM1549162.1 hypothetical protein [Clostridium sp.]